MLFTAVAVQRNAACKLCGVALNLSLIHISEDGRGVRDSKVMYEAMTIAAEKGLTVMSHAEDMDLSPIDYRLAENLETVRNIYIAEATGAKLHMCHRCV